MVLLPFRPMAGWSVSRTPDGALLIRPPNRRLGVPAIRRSKDVGMLLQQLRMLREFIEAAGMALDLDGLFAEADALVERVNGLAGREVFEKLP
jgi:hypothetical protein